MSCTPLNAAAFDLSNEPGFNIGGLSIPLPDLNIPFPELPIEDLEKLFDALGMLLPSGLMKGSFKPGVLNDVYAQIISLLEKFAPFLMLYKFFLPVLNLILCIIEVLCSIPNPFKLIRTLRRLFRVCIPEFLALFPFLALILMIIALLLLIIALIEYLIQRIIIFIETILKNIAILVKAASAVNSDSIIAVIKKVGNLLCALQNLFVVFALLNSILQIIKAMTNLTFRIPPCDSGDGSDDGCCTPDVCPEFIRENETIEKSTGIFQYLGEKGINSGLSLPVGFPPIFSVIRPESWQFYDPNLSQNQAFINITNAFDLPAEFFPTIFFPGGAIYTEQTNYTSAPYYINFQVLYDPSIFGRSGDIRYIKIKNVIVKDPPIAGVFNYAGSLVSPFNGTLNLIGGAITELDDTPLFNDTTGLPFTINSFFHIDTNDVVANPFDAIVFNDITYTFTINHPVLVKSSLITIGCVPEVKAERDWLATTIGAQYNDNAQKLAGIAGLLPDMTSAQQCINDAITAYSSKISTATTLTFRDKILECLNNLRNNTVNAIVETVIAGYDPYKSVFFLEPAIQFTTNNIQVKVSLNETTSNVMTGNLPDDVGSQLATKISAQTTFGEISNFTYDGSQYFVAEINSKEAGNGEIQVSFNNSIIGVINNPTDLDQSPSLLLTTKNYTFVLSQILGGGYPLRDEADTTRE